jgi:hypothetical protein
VQGLAERALGTDKEGYRREFVQLVQQAGTIKGDAKIMKVQVIPLASR